MPRGADESIVASEGRVSGEAESKDRVAWIKLNRPHRLNALSLKLCAEFQDAVALADRDPAVRVILITGAGDRAFSTGFDLDDDDEEIRPGGRTLEDWQRRHSRDIKFHNSVFECSKPVIAVINGYCLAGALELAQMCDIRYCSDDARFGVTETRFAAGVLTLAMPWVLDQRCRELIYTGDMIDAQEAYRLGLVNHVFPKDRLEEEATRIANRMSRVALPTLVWNKNAINHTLQASGFESALRYGAEACLIMENSDSEFGRFRELLETEGMAAAIHWRNSIFAPFESGTSASAGAAADPSKKAG
ncbi:enoyl-CoA hydratase/isomerase family protein [Kribbella sp. NPDC050820]|uniref:enoyl-CoA hydratase/isomerase family protein n=1 Tax=Kribbella sp. NPDC050820 TaxID=3155408 RepID=UPI0033F1C133